MLSDSLPDRDKVFMSDRSYRPLPHVEEVGEHLQLSVRSFPDGSCRISFSLRGLWAIGFSTDPFSEWAKAADSDEAGHLFQSDRGHPSNLMAAT